MSEETPASSSLPPITGAEPSGQPSQDKAKKVAPVITRGATVEETIFEKPAKDDNGLAYLAETAKDDKIIKDPK